MTRSCFLVYVVIVVVAVALAASPAFGQAESGTISGTVRDSTGAVIPGATVTIKNAGTSMQRTTQTGSLGQYSIAGLPTGNYAVTVAERRFCTFHNHRRGYRGSANDTAPFNPTLGIDDFGPFPSSMTRRNAFRGPGAWNTDLAVGKSFSITEDVKLQLRAEGFDIFNHHNLYVNESALSVSNTPGYDWRAVAGDRTQGWLEQHRAWGKPR